jgi:hypothetical protein
LAKGRDGKQRHFKRVANVEVSRRPGHLSEVSPKIPTKVFAYPSQPHVFTRKMNTEELESEGK